MPISEKEWEDGYPVSQIGAAIEYFKEIYPEAATIHEYRASFEEGYDADHSENAEQIADAVLRAYFESICQTLVYVDELETRYIESQDGAKTYYRYKKE
ncbi:hypothetical protein [Natrinema halophilum]|uniref:hypothetical protein n=1 Tax=Natrinema halophilum TaxID=1699371 RepID=UPI001F2DBF13|nr:hypothetical protein [Natrinema halophilum]UHQ96437.1 hypothetical protein HYG82_23645 [Natrinema halophilum]